MARSSVGACKGQPAPSASAIQRPMRPASVGGGSNLEDLQTREPHGFSRRDFLTRLGFGRNLFMRTFRLRSQALRSDLDFGRNQRLRDDDAERWLPGQFGAAERGKLASVAHPERACDDGLWQGS